MARKKQFIFGIILMFCLIILGFYFYQSNEMIAVSLIFGVSFGYVLQRSRFCFTAALRDPFVSGNSSLAKAVLVAIAVATVGFSAFKFSGGSTAINQINVNPISVPMVIGAILFGIGMVIASCCASGVLVRIGEGFLLQLLVLVFFIIGSLWGAHDIGSIWQTLNEAGPRIFLPDVFGWFGALVVQAGIILSLFILVSKWEQKKLK